MVKDFMELVEGCEERQKVTEQTGGEWPMQESTQAPGLSKQLCSSNETYLSLNICFNFK